MGKTSTEVKQRWINDNYERYVVSFRVDSDTEIINYIRSKQNEGAKTSEIFREVFEEYLNKKAGD